MFKKRRSEALELRKECDELYELVILSIVRDMSEYKENSPEFKFLRPFFLTGIRELSEYVTKSRHTWSVDRLTELRDFMRSAHVTWRLYVKQLEDRIILNKCKKYVNGEVDNDVKNTKTVVITLRQVLSVIDPHRYIRIMHHGDIIYNGKVQDYGTPKAESTVANAPVINVLNSLTSDDFTIIICIELNNGEYQPVMTDLDTSVGVENLGQ